jgi:hypothetical protein
MKKLRWYIDRLKAMSTAEMVFRVVQAFKYFLEKKTKVGFFPVITSIPETITLFSNITGYIKNKYPDEINIFGINYNYHQSTLWHKDLYSGKSFPDKYSRKIEIRTPYYGSAKHVWEINRMHFLTWICMNYKITEDEFYLNIFKEKIISWIKQNPYLSGINWYSNIEINIRLINWIICWEILEVEKLADKNKEFRNFLLNHWLPLIYLHCKHSSANPSYYSSANNHLIAEYAGLFLASLKWKFPESEKWLKTSKRGLEREIMEQHSENGINKEEAAEYIQFITDFFLLAYIGGRNAGVQFSIKYTDMLNKIISYINSFLDCCFHYPHYGDDDDGFVLRLDICQTPDLNFKSLLISGALLFDKADFLAGINENEFDIKNALLFGNEGRIKYDSMLKQAPGERKENKAFLYRNEGHFIIKQISHQKEIYCHIDAAPLGFLSIAAHGHADALSFIITVEGQPFLVDPGTYTYHVDPLIRSYFVGTLAHNTIRINGINQAVHSGPTMWTNHYKIMINDVLESENIIKITASHNGYKKTGVWHQRIFIFNRLNNEINITDNIALKSKQSVKVEMPFHLHPCVKCKYSEDTVEFLIEQSNNLLVLRTDKILEWEVIKGSTDPYLGWYSNAFHRLEPTNVILGKCIAFEDIVIHTQISLK